MSGPHPSKIELEDENSAGIFLQKILGGFSNAKVYIHRKDEESGSQNIHIDVEHEDLNEIIETGETAEQFLYAQKISDFRAGENSFVGGKSGGVFIGLKEEMIDRAKNWVKRNE